MNWKDCGRKRLWPNLKVLSKRLPGGTKENHENCVPDMSSWMKAV
jgi:hypothetical protein